jgi:transposase-like protein
MTVAKVRLAMAAMGQPKIQVAELCRELGVTRQTLYRQVSPTGTLREDDPGGSRLKIRLERLAAPKENG